MKRRKIKDLRWYAFEYDWNKKGVVRTNVLNTTLVEYAIKILQKNKITKVEDFKEVLKGELMYYYWCKSEHEVMVSGLFPSNLDNAVKIDIWYQLEPNLDRIVEYVIRELDLKLE